MLFDTDNDKQISRNEMQTLIKFCQPYIFKIRASDANDNNDKNKEQSSQLGNGEQQQNNFRGNQINQIDKLSQTQGNIVINDGYVTQDNVKILSKAPSKEFSGPQEISSNMLQSKQQKQQQVTQKEMQKKQQLLKAQQEKETMSYLFSKKQDKIAYQSFYNWAVEYFNIQEFFSIFELVPDPLLEREIIRSIIKEESAKERQINQLLINKRQKTQEEKQQQQLASGLNDKQENQKNKKEIPNNKQIKTLGSIEEKISQKDKFTETIYVVSWKWWFMWRYYINYAFQIKRIQNTNNNQKNDAINNTGDKNAQNAINFNIKGSNNPNQNKNKNDATNKNINVLTGERNQNNDDGSIREEQIVQNNFGANDVSNIAIHQVTQNNTFFNSREYFDSRANSPKNKQRPNHSPGRRDSNNSRNSMIDLEFNNSIPSERQEEQKVKYHLEPNAFKNNLEINMRNQQDGGSYYDPNYTHMDQSPNYIKKFIQQNQFISGMNQQNDLQFGGEEDVISDRNHFRPYSPSKVNHDANNLSQIQQSQFGMKVGKNQNNENFIMNQNKFLQQSNENEEDAINNAQYNSQHNQPQESQVKSVSHHHQFQQQSNFCTPRTTYMMGQYNQETSGIKQQNFTNQTEKQLLQNQNNQNIASYHNPRDISDSDLFQQPNWTNQQQYEPQNIQSPNKILSIQTNNMSGKKTLLINPQQLQQNNLQKQNQNTGRSDLDNFQNQGGIQMNSNQSIMNTPQLLNYPETPLSTAGLPQSANKYIFENGTQPKYSNQQQNQGTNMNFGNNQNDIDTISQFNIHNNGNNGYTQFHQYQNTMQGQNAQNNDNLTIYNEILHPETRQSHSQQLYTQQQQELQFPTTDNLNNILTEQAEKSEYGQNNQNIQNQKQIIQNQQNEYNQPTINPNTRGNFHQQSNFQKYEQNNQYLKNNDNPSTLFSQSKFNICKPLQGLSGETHDLISQDDLSKSNIAVNNQKRNENNTFAQQSEFAREQIQQRSVSPFKLYDKENSIIKENENQKENKVSSPLQQNINEQQNHITNNLAVINNKNNKQIDANLNNVNLNHQGTDKMLHDDYMDEIDKGIQNTEEFDNHEEEEQKKANDDHIRFQQYGCHNLGDRPTQIDNTDLEGEYQGELQKNILRNNDYVIIPEKAWEKLFGWYGGGPTFKRKRIVDIQKNYKTVELYPPLLIGYKLKKYGDINYDSRQELMVSSWKNMKDVLKKFQKYYKSGEDILYYKKMGSQWKKAVELDKTRLIDLQIESGTIFLFLTKNLEEKFLEKQKQKQNNQVNNNQIDILELYEVGDRICISHPSERIEKKGYIFQIKSEMIQIHFKRESFRNDITFEKKQLMNYLKQENNNQSQFNIDQSLTHLNHHIKYNPKMIGLANLGNTCFINCIIQFLVHTPFFRQYLLDELYLDSIKEVNNGNATNSNGNIFNTQNYSPTQQIQNNYNSNNQNERSQVQLSDQQGQIQLIRELSQLTQLIKQKPYNDIYDPIRPSNLKKAIDISMPHFSGHEQHDAQEFLQGFLDKLNDEVKIKKVVQVNRVEDNNQIAQSINNANNLNIRPNVASTSQAQQMTKSFNKNMDNLSLPKDKTLSKNLGDDIFNSQQPSFPPEPISNLPLQPALLSQGQSEQANDAAANQKKELNETVENQKRQVIQEIQEFSIIKDVYMGQTINKIQCSVCENINYKYEDFYTISLPLPIKNEVLYEVTFVPKVQKGIIKPIKKFGIKLPRSATFGEFQQAFYKTTKISPQAVVFAEKFPQYGYINSYEKLRQIFNQDTNLTIKINITQLNSKGIRINDEITAFEFMSSNRDLEDETFQLYPHNYQTSQKVTVKDLKEEDFVDFNIGTKWVHGQIQSIGQSDQKGEMVVSLWLIEENFKRSNYAQKFRSDSRKIQPFRSQVPLYPKERAFFVFVVNRRKINNTMEKFGIPHCIVVPSWLTWKELHLLVFSQIKRCIDFNYLIKKYQATSKALIKQKMKSAKTQGYTQLGGEQEELDYNNAVQTYKNEDFRSKEKSLFEQQQYVSEHNRQKAPSFHGFIEENPSQPIYEEDEYMRNRKSLFNYQQAVPIHSSKSPVRKSEDQKDRDRYDQNHPQLRPTTEDYQNLYKANTSTLINQNNDYQINGTHKSYLNGTQNSKQKNPQSIIKQSVNLESLKKSQNDNHNSNEQYEQSTEEYYAAFNGEIKDSIGFLQSSFFPYKLRVIDQITQRCAICDLPLIPDNAQRVLCQGCEPGLIERPFFWDVDQNNLLFAIDWKDSLSFNLSSMVPQNDESYIDLKKQKNEIKMGIPISSCFNLYTAQDKVELECDKCKVNQVQSTKHLLSKLPNVLINGLFEKIDDLVNFPLKKLDLSEWVFKENKSQQQQQKVEHLSDASTAITSSFYQNQSRFQKQNDQSDIYDLFAVVNHLGNGHGGHYTSFVNIKEDVTDQKDCWVNFDDESVNYINQEDIISNKGYLLIYKKQFSTSAIVNLTYKKL